MNQPKLRSRLQWRLLQFVTAHVATGEPCVQAKDAIAHFGMRADQCHHLLRTMEKNGVLQRVWTGCYAPADDVAAPTPVASPVTPPASPPQSRLLRKLEEGD